MSTHQSIKLLLGILIAAVVIGAYFLKRVARSCGAPIQIVIAEPDPQHPILRPRDASAPERFSTTPTGWLNRMSESSSSASTSHPSGNSVDNHAHHSGHSQFQHDLTGMRYATDLS